ncbi:multidrug efflux RND transporter permease subunit [Echinimonas agarilytica]|uniref:Multidrug efflux RND transporter permease subunit n=1 Tax=Echinimonas agarilytica TaxID=1215918 RepID=A0AA41W3L1_9GAMM|nr:multidrug efflux RND transporter permease subunit [Echinimonas agarilytica]MCM2678212.1 multidrug efflux RND transporter permease subunit [Echinimonas agarilytica]
MKFTDIFIRRPVLAISISLMLVLLGLQALRDMQVREYPEMTNTVITVTTSYWGANSDLIQGFITQPLEQAIAQADNVDFMTSQSYLGTSSITAQMKLNTNPNAALADVLAKVNSVRSQLPSEAEDPTVEMSTGSTTSVIYIAFTSPELNSSQINDYLERVIQPQLFTIPGVAKVNLFGGIKFALRVWLDPAKMAAFDLTATEVSQVLQANNFQSAPGQAVGVFTLYNGEVNTQVANAEELSRMVVASRGGEVVRLGDIADVSLEKSRDSYRAIADGKNAVVVALDPTPTANPLDITHEVRKKLPELANNLPDTINMNVLYDSTLAIEESINEVVKTIIEAGIIVLIVITLFLGNARAVIIPIITIPLSLIGVAMMMSFFGFSLNLMTLLAMVLAIGLVVDDAIVVVENVDRHIKMGKGPFEAAVIGTREIAVPVISMTITLAAVYAPIALMGGITGSLFKEFALTLAGAVFISGIVALTLSPMMCSVMLQPHSTPNRFEAIVERVLGGLNKRYDRTLRAVMAHRPVILVFAAFIFMSLPALFSFIPSELAPSEDKGGFMMMGKAPATANLDYIQNHVQETSEQVVKIPEIDSWLAFSGVPSSNTAMGILNLKTWSQRDRVQSEVIADTSAIIANSAGLSFSAFAFPELPGASSGLPVQFVITTPNTFESLFEVASNMYEKVKVSPQFVYTEMDLAYDSATMRIQIDRDRAGAYGITMQDVGITLSTMMSDGYINRVDLMGRGYEVITQVARDQRLNPESIKDYFVKASDGTAVPLSELVTIEVIGKPRALPHFNQLNSATIGAVAAPGTSMGDVVSYFENMAATDLPRGYQYDFLGESRQFVQEGSALYETFLLALAIIFLVLASQFESIRDPLVILVSVPLALCGALIALAWGLSTMNIYAQVGLVTLIGLISKHGILICEVAKEAQLDRGKDRMEAVIEAASVRLRPILMTTAAMVTGLVPLLLATGAGAISRFSIGIVIVSGLTIGTLFTLFVLPVIYTYLASKHQPLKNLPGETSSSNLAAERQD